jgi:hypothetical protein
MNAPAFLRDPYARKAQQNQPTRHVTRPLENIEENADAFHDLAWWAAERERVGTEWHSLLLNTVRALGLVTPCPTCGCEPCPLPSFCQLCREADAKAAPRHDKPRLRPTPQATIEAIKQAVRNRGVAALKEAATRQRLGLCDAAARAEIDRWLSAFKARREKAKQNQGPVTTLPTIENIKEIGAAR